MQSKNRSQPLQLAIFTRHIQVCSQLTTYSHTLILIVNIVYIATCILYVIMKDVFVHQKFKGLYRTNKKFVTFVLVLSLWTRFLLLLRPSIQHSSSKSCSIFKLMYVNYIIDLQLVLFDSNGTNDVIDFLQQNINLLVQLHNAFMCT